MIKATGVRAARLKIKHPGHVCTDEPFRSGNMTEAVGTCLICESFLEFLQGLAWCKQGDNTLVAVHKCTSEFVVAFGDHEVKVFPGGTNVKVNKSWLSYLQEKNEEGTPLPILLVWRPAGVELWYRRHNSWDFPYDRTRLRKPTSASACSCRANMPAPSSIKFSKHWWRRAMLARRKFRSSRQS
jgi:hypothetical protein